MIEGFCDQCRSLFTPSELSRWQRDIQQRWSIQDDLLDLEIRETNPDFEDDEDWDDLGEEWEFLESDLARNLERQRRREEYLAELSTLEEEIAEEERRRQERLAEEERQRQESLATQERLAAQERLATQEKRLEMQEVAQQLRTQWRSLQEAELAGTEERRERETARQREQIENEEASAELRYRVERMEAMRVAVVASMGELTELMNEGAEQDREAGYYGIR